MFSAMTQPSRIAFFDRDGTLNRDTGYFHDPNELELIPETVLAMRAFRDAGYHIVVVTNQAGIARGFYGVDDMRAVNRELNRLLNLSGTSVDAFYYCPHHPDFTGVCSCRKPQPGLFVSALRDFEADPADCVMYGNSEADQLAAQAAGVRRYFMVL